MAVVVRIIMPGARGTTTRTAVDGCRVKGLAMAPNTVNVDGWGYL